MPPRKKRKSGPKGKRNYNAASRYQYWVVVFHLHLDIETGIWEHMYDYEEGEPLMADDLVARMDPRYCIYKVELATDNGSLHLQMYIEFAGGVYESRILKYFPGAHLAVKNGSRDQARAYVMKEDTKVDDYVEYGVWFGKEKSAVKSATRDAVVKYLVETHGDMAGVKDKFPVRYCYDFPQLSRFADSLKLEYARELECFIIVGSSDVGKTGFAAMCYGLDRIFRLPLGDGKKLWFDNYDPDKHDVLQIDELDFGDVPRGTWLQLTDCYPIQVEIKGRHVRAGWHTVVCTMNPDQFNELLNNPKCDQAFWRRFGCGKVRPVPGRNVGNIFHVVSHWMDEATKKPLDGYDLISGFPSVERMGGDGPHIMPWKPRPKGVYSTPKVVEEDVAKRVGDYQQSVMDVIVGDKANLVIRPGNVDVVQRDVDLADYFKKFEEATLLWNRNKF